MPIAGDSLWSKKAYIDADGNLVVDERQEYNPNTKTDLDEVLALLAAGKIVRIDAKGDFSTRVKEAWAAGKGRNG